MPGDEAVATSTGRTSGWITLLVLFGISSTVEAFTVSHVFRFLPLYLATVQVAPAEVPAWTGYLNAAFFLFGLPLVPFWACGLSATAASRSSPAAPSSRWWSLPSSGSPRTAGRRHLGCSWSGCS